MNEANKTVAFEPGATPLPKKRPTAAKKVARKRKVKAPHMNVQHLGPIKQADITFGDLTVIVGPQATGKSLLLQTLKLLVDREHVHDTFKHHSMSFNGKPEGFMDAYFGRGMQGAIGKQTSVEWGGKSLDLRDYAKPSKSALRHERVFYIPAQRVMSLPGGISQNFGQFNFGDPYTLRAFSDAVHDLIIDEAAFVSDSLFNTLYPMLATTDGRCVLLSSANGKRGFFYRIFTDGSPEWHRVRITWRDISRFKASFIERTRHRIGEFWFRQEFECEFMDDESQLFATELVDAALGDIEGLDI